MPDQKTDSENTKSNSGPNATGGKEAKPVQVRTSQKFRSESDRSTDNNDYKR